MASGKLIKRSKQPKQPKTQLISHLLPEKKKKLLLAQGKIPDDYICKDCGFIYPFMLKMDGSVALIEAIPGAYPFCYKGDQSGHISRRLERLLAYGEYKVKIRNSGLKTVIFKDANGRISVPARYDEKTPKGYERIELSSLSEVDRFNAEMQAQAKLTYEQYHQLESQEWNHYYAKLGRELREGGTYIDHNGEEHKMPSWEEMSELGKDLARLAEKEFSQYRDYDPNYIPPTFISAAMFDEGSLKHRY